MREHPDTYEALARRCEAGAQELEHEAEHPAEVLAGRANGHRFDPQQWTISRRNAAQAARDYAAELRAEAGDNPDARPGPDRLAQASRVAQAAELGGILMDNRPPAERAAQSGALWSGEADLREWEAGTHPSQVKADQIEATGKFVHVAENIDGAEQVPFWQLGGAPAEQISTPRAEHTDRDGDEF
jgi:hypothetical protein